MLLTCYDSPGASVFKITKCDFVAATVLAGGIFEKLLKLMLLLQP
jgi:hypothetical protein